MKNETITFQQALSIIPNSKAANTKFGLKNSSSPFVLQIRKATQLGFPPFRCERFTLENIIFQKAYNTQGLA
jgi:hypothetical protein